MSTEDNPAAGRTTDYDAVIAASLSSLAASRNAIAKPETPAEAPAATVQPAVPAADTSADRVFAILDSDEGKERPGLARHLAKETSMSVDEARAVMAAAPVEKAEAKADDDGKDAARLDSALHQQMANSANSGNIKPEGEGAGSRKRFSEVAAEAPAKKKGLFS